MTIEEEEVSRLQRSAKAWEDDARLREQNAEDARAEVEALTEVNEDWMRYTIRLLRDIERLREENRSLMQTVRRVLRAAPVDER